jgi:hypothetical protein
VILVNGSNDAGRIDKGISKLPTSEKKIIIPFGSPDSERRQIDQLAITRKYKIVYRIPLIEYPLITGELQKLFAP